MKNYKLNEYYDLSINLLKIWTDNPRIGTAFDENAAINLLVDTVGIKQMTNLAKDIIENGLSETDIPSVVQENNCFLVHDGNRRISCLKILFNLNIIENDEIKQRFKRLLQEYGKDTIAKYHKIKVFNTTRERAFHLMDLNHNGELEGIGRVSWEAYQRDLALDKRGLAAKYKISLCISKILFGLPKKKNFTGAPAYTDLERIFGAKVIKDCIGITSDFLKLTKNEEDKIKIAYTILKEARTDLKISSYSRYFATSEPTNKNIINFIEYYNKKIAPLSKDAEETGEDTELNPDNQLIITNEDNNITFTEDSEDSQPNPGTTTSENNSDIVITDQQNHQKDPLPLQQRTRRTTRNTLITDATWESKYSTLSDKYAPIRSLIYHLRRISFDDDKIPDNTLILTLLVRALIDQASKAYREINKLESKDDLEGAITSNITKLAADQKMQKEIRKSINPKHIQKLQSYIHHYGARLGRSELINIFDCFQIYIELCLDELTIADTTK